VGRAQSPGAAVQTLSSIHGLGSDLPPPKQSAVPGRIVDILARVVIARHTTCKPHCWVRRDTRRQKADHRVYITQALRPYHSPTATSIKTKEMGSGCERHSLEFLRFPLASTESMPTGRYTAAASDSIPQKTARASTRAMVAAPRANHPRPARVRRASSSMGLTKPASNERCGLLWGFVWAPPDALRGRWWPSLTESWRIQI
jgi:hypothetical protein